MPLTRCIRPQTCLLGETARHPLRRLTRMRTMNTRRPALLATAAVVLQLLSVPSARAGSSYGARRTVYYQDKSCRVESFREYAYNAWSVEEDGSSRKGVNRACHRRQIERFAWLPCPCAPVCGCVCFWRAVRTRWCSFCFLPHPKTCFHFVFIPVAVGDFFQCPPNADGAAPTTSPNQLGIALLGCATPCQLSEPELLLKCCTSPCTACG